MSQGILRAQHSPACWGLTPQLMWQIWASGAEPWMHLAKSSWQPLHGWNGVLWSSWRGSQPSWDALSHWERGS